MKAKLALSEIKVGTFKLRCGSTTDVIGVKRIPFKVYVCGWIAPSGFPVVLPFFQSLN